MFDLTLQQIFIRILSLLVITGTHGFFVAWVARLLGDRGPGYDGRLNPNPFQHMSGLGFVGFLFYQLGWLKPVAVDPKELRLGRAGLVLVAIGALVLSLLLALVVWELREFVFLNTGAPLTVNIMNTFVNMTVWFAALNLVPAPPLTMGYLLQAIAPPAWHFLLRRLYLPTVILVVLIVTEIARPALLPVHDAIAGLLGFDALLSN